MSIEELAALSRHYGSDSEYVIAGGGNTSFKDESTLWVKGSGVSLGEIKPDDFVRMDRGKLAAIWKKEYPRDTALREAAVLADMLAARKRGEENKRPSVETLLHDLLPFPWVVHLHPALVNGLACSAEGRDAAERLFGPVIWIESENPGYVLSIKVKEALENSGGAALSARPVPGNLVFLQNHGVFAAADTPDGIKTLYAMIMDTINTEIRERPGFEDAVDEYASSAEAGAVLAECANGEGGGKYSVVFARNRAIAGLVADRDAFSPVASAFTPDHIVYAGSDPLFVESPSGSPGEHIRKAWKDHIAKFGRAPKIAALSKTGVFGIGVSQRAARLAIELFTDAVKVAVYTKSFGGPRFMEADKIAFINNWEAERYRSQRSGS